MSTTFELPAEQTTNSWFALPKGWKTVRLKSLVASCANGIWGDDPNGVSDLVCVRVADFDMQQLGVSSKKLTLRAIEPKQQARRLLKPGDLLLEKSGGGELQPVGRVVAFDLDCRAVCSNFVGRLTPESNLVRSKYLLYIFEAMWSQRLNVPSIKQTTGIQNLDEKHYFQNQVPLPPIADQDAIVTFLDRKLADIDRFISNKRRMIEMLAEQETAVVSHFALRGINPNTPTKEAGDGWSGVIPRHWQMVPAKWLFTQRTEPARDTDIQLSATQAYGVISQDEYERRVSRRVVKITQHLEKRKHVEVDDFVISMRSFQGGIERAWEQGAIRSSYVVMKPSAQVLPDFFQHLLKSQPYIMALRRTANFIRDGQDLNFGNFTMIPLPSIPIDEQKQIAYAITRRLSKIKSTAQRIENEIILMKEFRTALIAEAVTGRIDVQRSS